MTITVIEKARVFDGHSPELMEGACVLFEGGDIKEVSTRAIASADARRINAGSRVLSPGFIDLHIHAYASEMNLQLSEQLGPAYNGAHAARMLGHALDCGFTTVRDIGGGDWRLAATIDRGFIRAPRFFYAGRILSMTGGHGDLRPRHVTHADCGPCGCSASEVFTVLADGVDECIKAAREELRLGAHCIKIMGSGGVASPSDPIWMNQYREDEIRAIVGECRERRTYVSSHCHAPEAIRRSVDYGVRVIEHGSMMDAETANHVARSDAYIVPTMAIVSAMVELGASLGLPPVSLEKVKIGAASAFSALEEMRRADLRLGFGTDLLGDAYDYQSREFTLRRDVFAPIEILRQATSASAEILMQEGRLGCIAPGAAADIILIDGDPLEDISILAEKGRNVPFVMRAGDIVKNWLAN